MLTLQRKPRGAGGLHAATDSTTNSFKRMIWFESHFHSRRPFFPLAFFMFSRNLHNRFLSHPLIPLRLHFVNVFFNVFILSFYQSQLTQCLNSCTSHTFDILLMCFCCCYIFVYEERTPCSGDVSRTRFFTYPGMWCDVMKKIEPASSSRGRSVRARKPDVSGRGSQ